LTGGPDFLTGIQAVTTSFDSPAPGGNIQITAGSVELDHMGSVFTTSYGLGAGGNIEVTAGNLTLAHGSTIRADGADFGPGGRILLHADQNLALTEGSEIITSALLGSGGDIEVTAGNLSLADGSTIRAEGLAIGPAGRISLRADHDIALTGNSSVSTSALDGSGGDIEVTAAVLSLADGSTIRAEGLALGPAGRISLDADQDIALTGNSSVSTSALDGGGGDIGVTARNLSLADGSTIRAEGLALGPAGTISIIADQDIALTRDSAISTSALLSSGGDIDLTAGVEIQLTDSRITAQAGPGGGGEIALTAPSTIYLLNSFLTAQAEGDGGNLSIVNPDFFIMNNGGLISMSSSANGGRITILSDYFFQSGSTIDASAPFGLPGTVSISAPQVDLSGSLVGLPGNLLDAASQLRADCAVRLVGDVSSFIVLGRGGLPVAPGGFVPSGMVLPQ
jgi:hypothetical protein